jgi:hypothetical protein
MIEKAARLAEARGWGHDVLSSLHLALAIPSPKWRITHSVEIYCSTDGGAWGFVMLKELSLQSDRHEQAGLAVRQFRQFFAPAEFDLSPEPDCCIKYALDLDIEEDVEFHLGRALDEAVAQMDMAWTVLQLINFGDKSADEAIAHVNASTLQELRQERQFDTGSAG